MKRFEYWENGRRTNLRTLFRTWHLVLDQYDKDLFRHEDSLTWYKERTHIGLVAIAAARRSGILILEEYPTVKTKGKAKGKRKTKGPGRADLYLELGSGKDFNFEAKFLELSLRSRDMARNIRNSIRDAVRDARHLDREQAAHSRVGLVFVIPYLTWRNPKTVKSKASVTLRAFRECLLETGEFDADFVYIHLRDENLTNTMFRKYIRWTETGDASDGPYWEPGIAVIGKFAS